MKEVYVVMRVIGEYECEYTRSELVVNTKQEAEKEVLRLNSGVPAYCERIDRLVCKISSYAAHLADKAHSDKQYEGSWYEVFDSAYGTLIDKVRKKYPTLTDCYDESTEFYYYERCEFKGG